MLTTSAGMQYAAPMPARAAYGTVAAGGYARAATAPQLGAAPAASFMATSPVHRGRPIAAAPLSMLPMRGAAAPAVVAAAPAVMAAAAPAVAAGGSMSTLAGGSISVAAATTCSTLVSGGSAQIRVRVGSGATASYTEVSSPQSASPSFSMKQGDKVQIRTTYKPHAGKWAYIDGVDASDGSVRITLEEVKNEYGDKGPGNTVLCISPMHLDLFGADGGASAMNQQFSVDFGKLSTDADTTGLVIGAHVRLGGAACPSQYCGKTGYIVKADCADGTGRMKIRIEPTYSVHQGFIPTGGTFLKEMMTVEEAKVKCGTMGGKGFTHEGGVGTYGQVMVFVKNHWDCTADYGWTSYKLEADPDGLPAWTLVSPMHLTLV